MNNSDETHTSTHTSLDDLTSTLFGTVKGLVVYDEC